MTLLLQVAVEYGVVGARGAFRELQQQIAEVGTGTMFAVALGVLLIAMWTLKR